MLAMIAIGPLNVRFLIIKAERHGDPVKQLILDVIARVGDDDVALSCTGLTEFVHGMYRTPKGAIQGHRQEFLQDLLKDLPVYDFTTYTTLLAGRIAVEQTARGLILPFPDMLISATPCT